MKDRIKLAAAQIDPKLKGNDQNLEKMLRAVKEAAVNKADLVVFPECSLSGYVYFGRDEAMPYAETVPGTSTEKIASLCREFNIYTVFGLLEKDGQRLYNAAAFIGPEGLIGNYRKNHLPYLGIDRFADIGDRPFGVYKTPIGNIGICICYDIVFPESARVMTLMGADIIAHPTNFPEGSNRVTNYVLNSRAIENNIHVVSTNRAGTELGYSFCGQSKIITALGDTIALASPDKEETIYGEVSLEKARQKHAVFVPGEWEVDRIGDRRPELYNLIAQPKPDRR